MSDDTTYTPGDSPLDEDFQPKSSRMNSLERDRTQPHDPFPKARPPDSKPCILPSEPPILNLGKDGDITAFLAQDIGEDLKKAALRQFFHSPEFNFRDGLDDYDEDFQAFERLGDVLTSDMRYHLERLSDPKKDSDLKQDPAEALHRNDSEKSTRTFHTIPNADGDFKSDPEAGLTTCGNLFIDPALCAHGARGLTGCSRCLEACPAGAIHSVGETIEIDGAFCREKGVCTVVCPTGALTMNPSVDLLASIRLSLAAASCANPGLMIHDAGLDPGLFETVHPEIVLCCVDSIEAVGMEIWLSALAYGASHVVMVASDTMEPEEFNTLQTHISWALKILEGMGLEKERIQIIRAGHLHGETPPHVPHVFSPVCPTRPARFDPGDTKRQLIFQSIDYLYQQARGTQGWISLETGAPFGEIIIDPDTCTLCLACVAICPAKALRDGREVPQVQFLEGRCVQCGLCARVCPEHAVRLSPQMVFKPKTRNGFRILHEAEPFCCVACGKPFSTQAMVDKMAQMLSRHSMYQSEGAKKSLFMCGDCRARTFFEAGGL